jgi:hypothetical protein
MEKQTPACANLMAQIPQLQRDNFGNVIVRGHGR